MGNIHSVEPKTHGGGGLLEDRSGQRTDVRAGVVTGIGGTASHPMTPPLHVVAFLAVADRDATWPPRLHDVQASSVRNSCSP